MEINSTVLIGRLTRDAELKYTPGGLAICTFSLAHNRKKKSGDQWIDEANFFDVSMMGKGAEGVHKHLVKGKLVGVMGELRQSRWEQDGKPRSRVYIQAFTLQLLGGDPGKNATGSQPTYAADPGASTEFFDDDVPF